MKEEKSFDNLKGSFEVAVLCDKHLTIGINRLDTHTRFALG